MKSIRWFFSKRRWEVFYDAGTKQLGIRKIKYLGKIKDVDWSNYRTKEIFATTCNYQDLQKLRDDIDVMLKYSKKEG
jgi:hypothetical protein